MIMDEEKKTNEPPKTEPVRPRPVPLTALCLISFVYFAILSLFCLAGLFYSGWITRVTLQYLPMEEYTKTHTLLVSGAGFFLHGLAFTGVLLIWKLRKTGYYMLGLSCLIIAAIQLLIPSTAITSTAIYVIFLLLFGIFFRRMH
jgi:hypothetical protein